MLSPKMQRTVRVNESQVLMLSDRAQFDHSLSGHLHKRTADSTKWRLRWFVLYQNLLFYYESESGSRPSGVILLEGCYCERLITTTAKTKETEKAHCFAISYRRENQRQYELRASTENDCKTWIQAIREASFNKLLLQKEELEQKHLHLLQIVESEKTAKWQYTQQCEELTSEIKKLRAELCALKKEWKPVSQTICSSSSVTAIEPEILGASGGAATEETAELRKIKKVQSFFRGWLCRRRWKQIVEQYIKSPHAESMRKRNSLVFRMVESEEEYMEQLEVLVSCFLRPFKMAASSKKPPCSHEDVNSIFLNTETVMFLHQIFLKGLTSRMESWPTLVLGDLFDMLLPMLSIYQEYVRNHHFSLQVLTECKQSQPFANLLARLENKPMCRGRSLETLLTYPMHQIPRYIITLHEVLAHTPHDHVERKSLMNARQQLEDLSRQMHDEVSETENLRKNLAVERMIVEGCDILLDVNQVFVRQGTLLQFPYEKPRTTRSRLPSFKGEKEALRQCFLFSHHLIIATRTSGGRLHLVPEVGKIPLADATLIEDPSEQPACDDDESSVCSMSSQSSENSNTLSGVTSRDFHIHVDVRSGNLTPLTIHLMAPTLQEKAAWVSDILQCMDNLRFNDLVHGSFSDTSSVSMAQSMKNDPKLFKDDVDIRFSRTLNSCKVPQIRYATPERLLDRLTDLRFLSIDFLNTFLLTYRVFTDGVTVLEALKKVYYEAEPVDKPLEATMSSDEGARDDNTLGLYDVRRRSSTCVSPRRVSAASSVSGYGSEMSERDRSHSYDSQCHPQHHVKSHWRCSYRKFEEEQRELALIKENTNKTNQLGGSTSPKKIVTIRVESEDDGCHLTVPHNMNASLSNDTLTELNAASAPTSPSNLSTVTLVASDNSDNVGAKSIEPEETSDSKPEISRMNVGRHSITPEPSKITVTLNESELDPSTLVSDSAGFIRRGSMKFLREVSAKDEQPRRKSMQETTNTISTPEPKAEQKPKRRDTLKLFQRDKSSSVKKEKPESAKEEKSPSKFSDRFLSIDSKFRRPRSKSAERRARTLTRRKGSEGGSVPPDFKRKVSDGGASREGSLRYSCKRNLDGSSREHVEDRTWTRGWGSKRKSSGSVHGRFIDVEFSDESGSEWANTARSASITTTNSVIQSFYPGSRRDTDASSISHRASFQHESPIHSSKAGVVITSFRQSKRRSSTSAAAAAFAVATSASSNPRERPSICSSISSVSRGRQSVGDASVRSVSIRERGRKESGSSPATMRVLNVLRHWVSKHTQDFESDQRLKNLTIEFLEDILYSSVLLPVEQKAVSQLLRIITKEDPESSRIDLTVLLTCPTEPSKESIETLSALEIAEQITFIDHQIFISIRSEEFLGQAWMKSDKVNRAPNILLMTRRFNEVSQLVVSEIVRRSNLSARVAAIEKWAAVADISRCLHNFNGVLQICAAFTNSAVFRLRKTWEKVSKTTKQTIERLQTIVSSDSRFRNLRDALHRCDPPCIPYLGMYLTDLSFIEEGTPNYTEDGLLNFSKMRMIAHVIREIKHYQQSRYKIERIPKVTSYLLDMSLVLDEDEVYQKSLELEPRMSRLASATGATLSAPGPKGRY